MPKDSLSNEPLQDDVALNSPYSSDGTGNMITEPDKLNATGVDEGANMDASSEDDKSDNLQWGYAPRSRLGEILNRLIPHGGAISNIYSMCAVTLGSGIFSLPYAFKLTGIATAIIVLVVISLATVYSVFIMVQAVEKTRAIAKAEAACKYNHHNQRKTQAADKASREDEDAADKDSGTMTAAAKEKGGFIGSLKQLNEEGSQISSLFLCSYEQLARGLMGRGWDYFAAFNMWFFCFGSCVSYVITVNDLIITALRSSGKTEGWLYTNEWGSKVLTIAVWAVLMLPLSIPKQINSLRYVSVVTVLFIVYFCIVVVVHSGQNAFYREGGSGTLKLKHSLSAVKSGNNALNGSSMYIFAFLLQTNVLQLQREAKKPSVGRITRDTGIATALCTALYILVGFFGYAEFGELIDGSILLQYNLASEPAIAVGYVMLGLKLSLSFAICMIPSRDSVYYCIGTNARTIRTGYHVVIVTFFSIVALILGLVIQDVTIVFSLVGSLGGGCLGFIFPAFFFMYAGDWNLKRVGIFHWTCTYLLLIAGVAAVVWGTGASIWAMT